MPGTLFCCATLADRQLRSLTDPGFSVLLRNPEGFAVVFTVLLYRQRRSIFLIGKNKQRETLLYTALCKAPCLPVI